MANLIQIDVHNAKKGDDGEDNELNLILTRKNI